MENDDQLILRCGRDPAAFRELVLRYEARMYGFMIHMAGREHADDLFQDFWLRVLKASPRYEPRGQAPAWLFKIARGLALNRLSRAANARRAPLEAADGVPDRGPSPAESFENRALKARIEAALAELPSEQREVFLLREMGRLSFKEIAEELGIPLGTALSRMSYALRKLRLELEAEHA